MTSTSAASVSRVYVYVDGFNFYLSTKGTEAYPYGWCNWRRTAENYCGQTRSVVRVKYFTSEIITSDNARRKRQELHIAAMKTIADVILGRFVPRTHTCKKCGWTENFTREKKTDTNIAIQMVFDAGADLYDEAFLVTADMDLLPAVEMVSAERFFRRPRKVTVLIPPHAHTSQEFLASLEDRRNNLIRAIELRLANLVRFPEQLATDLGYSFPRHWALGSTGPSILSEATLPDVSGPPQSHGKRRSRQGMVRF